jgi:hypothetical protein
MRLIFIIRQKFKFCLQNVFSIDDGELRLYDDPSNREFLMSVMSGRIPKELITEARGGEVHVNMEDHKEEEFQKPKVCNLDCTLYSYNLKFCFVILQLLVCR